MILSSIPFNSCLLLLPFMVSAADLRGTFPGERNLGQWPPASGDCCDIGLPCTHKNDGTCFRYQIGTKCFAGTRKKVCEPFCTNSAKWAGQDEGCPATKTKICVKANGKEPPFGEGGDKCVRCINNKSDPDAKDRGCWLAKPRCVLDSSGAEPGLKKAGNKCVEAPEVVTIGVNASVWDSEFACDLPDICIPIGGSGQENGNFTMLTKQGIEFGIRTQERRNGPVPPIADPSGLIGIYQAETGYDLNAPPSTLAWWNFDWHVDLRGGTGIFEGKTFDDFLFGFSFKCLSGCTASLFEYDLTGLVSSILPSSTVLSQNSWNPLFDFLGFTDYDLDEAALYEMCFVLEPQTFSSSDLTVCMHIEASDPP